MFQKKLNDLRCSLDGPAIFWVWATHQNSKRPARFEVELIADGFEDSRKFLDRSMSVR